MMHNDKKDCKKDAANECVWCESDWPAMPPQCELQDRQTDPILCPNNPSDGLQPTTLHALWGAHACP